jgi:soluble lytic murein transglycosylase
VTTRRASATRLDQRARGRARAAAARRRRRSALLALVALGLATGAVALVTPLFRHAVQEVQLPLRHEDIIRQQAAAKGLDPALLAGVIYAESKFVGRTSPAGAEGLMQLMPATAEFIARRSGGTRFRVADLAAPQINIAYGAWYLRYLENRYGGNEVLAIAAYNGGAGNVDRWLSAAAHSGRRLRTSDIPFPETRAYVDRVLRARARYRATYAHELGLD